MEKDDNRLFLTMLRDVNGLSLLVRGRARTLMY